MTNLIDSSDDMDTTGKKKLNTAMLKIPQASSVVVVTSALDTTQHLEVTINGTVYKLAMATS